MKNFPGNDKVEIHSEIGNLRFVVNELGVKTRMIADAGFGCFHGRFGNVRCIDFKTGVQQKFRVMAISATEIESVSWPCT